MCEKFPLLSAESPIDAVAPESPGAPHRYHWPGNIRELRNVIERAMIVARRRSKGAWWSSESVASIATSRFGRMLARPPRDPTTQLARP